MSWASAARTAPAENRPRQQPQLLLHMPQQRQRQQQPQRRRPLKPRELPQSQQLKTQLQLPRGQHTHTSNMVTALVQTGSSSMSRAAEQYNENTPPKHSCFRIVRSRSGKNSNGDEAALTKRVPPKNRKCNSSCSVSEEATLKRGTQPGSAIVASQMFKTKLCIDHQTRGCTRGENCPYAHSVEEMRNLPDLRKTKMCSLVLAGKGCQNRACKFAHSEEELRYTCAFSEFKTRICRFAQERGGRGCLYGVRCPYAHSPSELRTLKNATNSPTELPYLEEKDEKEGVSNSEPTARTAPLGTDRDNLKGKHGLWGQRVLRHEHSPARQKEAFQHHQQEQLNQSQQRKPRQKSLQPTTQLRALQVRRECQRQHVDLQQQTKLTPGQPPHNLRQEQLKTHVWEEWTSCKPGSQVLRQANARDESLKEEVPEQAEPDRVCHNDPSRSALIEQRIIASPPRRSQEPDMERSPLARLPPSLNKGRRAISAVIDKVERESKNVHEVHSQNKKELNNSKQLHRQLDAYQMNQGHTHERKTKNLQYNEACNRPQNAAPVARVQQQCWRLQPEEVDSSAAMPDLLSLQRAFLGLSEHARHSVLSRSSPPTALSSQLVEPLTTAREKPTVVQQAHELVPLHDEPTDNSVNGYQHPLGHRYPPVTCAAALEPGMNSFTSRGDPTCLQGTIKYHRYNGSVAVLPPPGFEHVRIKPLPEVTNAGAAPWTGVPSRANESLLFQLHRQLLLQWKSAASKRQSNIQLLSNASTSPVTSHTRFLSDTSKTDKVFSAASCVDGRGILDGLPKPDLVKKPHGCCCGKVPSPPHCAGFKDNPI